MSTYQPADVTKEQLDQLTANYRNSVKRVRKGTTTVVDYDPAIDTRSIFIPRDALEAFLNEQEAEGIRIYLGVHDTVVMNTPYDDKLMVVLVATKLENGTQTDQIFEEEECERRGLHHGHGKGCGMNHLAVCPPSCTWP